MVRFDKKLIIFSFIFIISSFFLGAQNKRVEEIIVENKDSWQESFDLETRKPGKYNIMVTARDLGGNIYVEGPYNIYYDPKSDLPICGITNPVPNMRIVGNLNIVGTCVDDDGVSRVDLILDEGTAIEQRVTAEGTEFWSYYLDTTSLDEGPHTIKVIGYDINEVPVQSIPVSLVWQLDRKQPETQVLKPTEMGTLVSGNVHFDGIVFDGNGIEKLEYSIDNGQNFIPTKINYDKKQDKWTFDISVDTKKLPDGPSVMWFRATDKATSVGLYSFLYYIDNTKPDVRIVSPIENEVMNGKFTVAGFAKDKVGITQLSWTFGTQTGEFELIPGNPYWTITLDTIGTKEKSQKFTIHAVDRANNIVEVSRNIPLNQENDKPIVTISEPVESQIFTEQGELFVRGFATDDDSVKSVKIQLDNEEEIIQDTKGSFYHYFMNSNELSFGKHKITVTAIDENNVLGNPVIVNFESKGLPPEFSDAKIIMGKESIDFEDGAELHPESNSSISVTANSSVGIKHIHTKMIWGETESVEQDLDLKNLTSYTHTLPISFDSPKGVMKYIVEVTDIIDRISTFTKIFYVTNTNQVKNEEPTLIFDDSRISEEGFIENIPEFPASGYLFGGNAQTVELVPQTPFARAELVGNQVKLIPLDAIGTSDEVVVTVKTDKGIVVKSRPIRFRNDNEIPEIQIDGYLENFAIDGKNGSVEIKGKAICKTGMAKINYRVLSINTDIQKGVIASAKPDVIPQDFQSLELDKDGNFSLNVDSSSFVGIQLIEFVAESLGGKSSAKTVAINTIPEVEEQNGKMPSPKAPQIFWLDGFDVYAVCVYQGETDKTLQTFPRLQMNEGANSLVWDATVTETQKVVSSKFTANKKPTLSANIALVNGEEYLSGMPVILPYGVSKTPGNITVYIDTGATVSSVAYEIFGEETYGGDNFQKGSAKLIKPSQENPTRWIAEIPLNNLPARINNISLSIKATGLETSIKGCIKVVREFSESIIEDKEKIYTITDGKTIFDESTNCYILSKDCSFLYYANVTGPIKAELVSATQGLKIDTIGKLIRLTAEKDTSFKNVTIKVTDRFGGSFTSESLNFISDTAVPELNILTPELHQWLGNTVKISGTVADPLGIKNVEYSLDNGNTWSAFTIDASKNNANNLGVTFSHTVDIASFLDGLIKIDVRAFDGAGHSVTKRTAAFKDVTPPNCVVIEPLDEDVVNGQNLIVFSAKDNGKLVKAEYVSPQVKGKSNRIELPLEPLISTYIGTEEKPIDDAMSFVFTDEAGNSTSIEAWMFNIDSESDLPVAEIHVPEELQVITRDFVISGVIYDDDGPSSVYYKIDDGEYKQVSTNEVYKGSRAGEEFKLCSSFQINVPLETMTDNEHTITVYAVDINGVKGNEVSRTYRISLEEPKGAVELPTIDTSVRNVITISGWASDKNGIKNIQVSLDNGNTYNDAEGTTEWKYVVDTRAIPGGTSVVFLKVTDNYGIQGLYSSLINIDNDAPELTLELPLDDSTTTGTLFFSGHTFDNVEVTDLFVTIRNLEKSSKPNIRKVKIDQVIGEIFDITDLEDGSYNVELTAKDKAGNITNVSRNIHLDKKREPATVDILYPLNGEHKQGVFTIYGQTSSEKIISELKLYIDTIHIQDTQVTSSGFYKFDLGPETISEGTHTYRVDAILEDGTKVPSREQTITYAAVGPWITIDNFTYGDFATNRPFIRGQAGYSIRDDELLFSKTKEATPEQKAAVAAKKVEKIEISFDNGKTFTQLSKNEKWMYRIENEDMPNGYHFLLIRATMKNGETAITRTIIQIDNTKPSVKLISPAIGGRYNQTLAVSGLAGDDVRLEEVKVALRKGDKAAYEVPSFIQGLYLDFRFWGATLFAVGAGLTAFDDAVKLQASFGQFTQAQRDAVSRTLGINMTNFRYGGNIFSFKILANIASLPFSFFFGHDWDWLSAAFAVGADFSWFSDSGSKKSQILSSLIAQLEFPKIKIPNVKAFSSFSFYTEGSCWFIPSDVSSDKINNLIPQIAIGIRANVF